MKLADVRAKAFDALSQIMQQLRDHVGQGQR